MKTTRIFTALSFTLTLLVSSFVIIQTSLSSTLPIPTPKTRQTVTYVVTVENTVNIAGYVGNYYIRVVNDHGRDVAIPQLFHPGLWTYTFTEYGTTFQGTRTALMASSQSQGTRVGYTFTPNTLNGPFTPGHTYSFVLVPQVK